MVDDTGAMGDGRNSVWKRQRVKRRAYAILHFYSTVVFFLFSHWSGVFIFPLAHQTLFSLVSGGEKKPKVLSGCCFLFTLDIVWYCQ